MLQRICKRSKKWTLVELIYFNGTIVSHVCELVNVKDVYWCMLECFCCASYRSEMDAAVGAQTRSVDSFYIPWVAYPKHRKLVLDSL